MTITDKLDYLQEKLSDKTLSMGCKVFHKADMGYCSDSYRTYPGDDNYKHNSNEIRNIDKIIGHPVMADHILLWGKKHNLDIEIDSTQMIHIYMGADFYIPLQLGKDLTQQSEETINKLFAFVKNIEEREK